MDDYLTSFLEEEVAVSTQADLIAMFQKGGFELTKFATNNKVVLDSIPPSHQLMSNVEWDSDSYLKILGIQWNPNTDYFSFTVKASPYLAQRVLAQLASDSSAQHPLAAQETQQFFYMDDYLTSFLEEEVAVSTQADLIAMFQEGGFELTKFATNNKVVLDSIPPSHQLMSNVEWDSDSYLKILGIQWNPNKDYFSFTVNVFENKVYQAHYS
jgi:hypothetical protein